MANTGSPPAPAPYVELHAHSAFSFLDGASHPEELVLRARELGYPALALTDHDGLYASMDSARAAREAGLQPDRRPGASRPPHYKPGTRIRAATATARDSRGSRRRSQTMRGSARRPRIVPTTLGVVRSSRIALLRLNGYPKPTLYRPHRQP